MTKTQGEVLADEAEPKAEPGSTVFVVVTENEGNPPKLGVFASAAGASS